MTDQVPINLIGSKQSKRSGAKIADINKVEGLKKILDQDFESWSNFDSWGHNNASRWVFSRAMDISNGKKIDIQCSCCEYKGLMPPEDLKLKNAGLECKGSKTAYMVEKVLYEINTAPDYKNMTPEDFGVTGYIKDSEGKYVKSDCYGDKAAQIIDKVAQEIIDFKEQKGSDGTYSA